MEITTIITHSLFYAVLLGIMLSNLARPKTKNCRYCGTQMGTKYTNCPSCGRRQPPLSQIYLPGMIKFGFIIFVVLFVVMFIASLFS